MAHRGGGTRPPVRDNNSLDPSGADEIVEQAPPGPLFSEPSDERTRRFLRRIVDAGRM
jgi:hypothetical protein